MTDLLTAHAANQPDKTAVIDDWSGTDVRVCSYAELEARSNRLARVISEHGVLPGGKVVWCGQNSIGIAEMVNAARKVGATAVPLTPRVPTAAHQGARNNQQRCLASLVIHPMRFV